MVAKALEAVGLLPVGPQKVFNFLLPPVGGIPDPPVGDEPSRGYKPPKGLHLYELLNI